MVIRNIPAEVHEKLRAIAKREGRSVEALARDALRAATEAGGAGVDFEALARKRRALGLDDIGDGWIDAFDEPELGRALLGLDRS